MERIKNDKNRWKQMMNSHIIRQTDRQTDRQFIWYLHVMGSMVTTSSNKRYIGQQ